VKFAAHLNLAPRLISKGAVLPLPLPLPLPVGSKQALLNVLWLKHAGRQRRRKNVKRVKVKYKPGLAVCTENIQLRNIRKCLQKVKLNW
jgi:hypothetical protein